MVPEFIGHARAAYPDSSYELGSAESLDAADHSVAGLLAWYSLIHLAPHDLQGVLTEFQRAMAPAGMLVLGLFDGAEMTAFDHKVVTAYRWPVDEISRRLARAGFTEVERLQRGADDHHRAHAAIAAVAADQ
jgi:hypothetical protein